MDIFAATDLPINQHSKIGANHLPAVPQTMCAVPKRESVDSGLSLSPSSMVTDYSAGTSSGSSMMASPPTEQSGTSSGSTGSGSVKRRRKKKRLAHTLSAASFNELYSLKGEELGHGSYGRVETCIHLFTGVEYAVKIIDKDSWQFQRQKMLKEIELYHFCSGQDSIIQLIEYFEEDDHFYLIFEKAQGGHLLKQINQKLRFDEKNAAKIVAKLAKALKYLHSKGIAHRDIKPENVLCMEAGDADQVASSIRLCDFDLCSNIHPTVTTPRLQSPVGSAEYMAPEVVDSFIHDDDLFYDLVDDDLEDFTYDKRCDLWSLGVIGYTLLCGFLPFNGCCGEDCGWNDRDEECSRCQEDLFNSIKRGSLHFPDQYWSKISSDAKDLLIKLLQKNPNDRLEAAEILNHPWIIQMTSTTNENNNNNNISEKTREIQFHEISEQQQKVILANDNQIDTTITTTTTTSKTTTSPNEDDTVNKQLSEVNKQLTDVSNQLADLNKQLTSAPIHFEISSPFSNNDENVPPMLSPNTITNNLRKAMSTHLWSPTMSQNRPAVRAVNKMRRQSSVVEFYLQNEDSYLSRCEY
jgi:MAP kinase interacting serine/threonine kinase